MLCLGSSPACPHEIAAAPPRCPHAGTLAQPAAHLCAHPSQSVSFFQISEHTKVTLKQVHFAWRKTTREFFFPDRGRTLTSIEAREHSKVNVIIL